MKITLETATLVDSIRKAEAIAPKTGDTTDTTYGIILESDLDNASLMAKATDGIFFYMESIPILSIEGTNNTTWRVPSSIFYGSISKLPTRMGSQVTLESEGTQLVIRSGKAVIKLAMMAYETFPEFEFYDSEGFHEFTNITGKSNKLKWATSTGSGDPKNCVLVRDDKMYATSGFVAARIILDDNSHITALYPPLTMSRVVPFGQDVRVAKDGNLLVISPDEYSQLLMATMDSSTFPADAIDKMMEQPLQYKSSFSKKEMVRMLEGVGPLIRDKKDGQGLTLYVGKGEVAVWFESEAGSFGDKVEATGSCELHGRIKMSATHSILKGAIDTLADIVEMEYNEFSKVLRFNDGNYSAVIALRNGGSK